MQQHNLKTDELQIENLHCADCADTIEKTVAKVNGVDRVNASFMSRKVKIRYDTEKVEYDQLVQSVEKIGYHVSRTAHRTLEKKIFWQDREVQFTAVSGLLLGLGLAIKLATPDPTLFSPFARPVSASAIPFLISVLFGAYYFSREGWAAIKSLKFNMDFLMAIAIIGAIIIGEFVEAASLAFLFSMAELLESYAVDRARNSLRELMQLTPEEARVKRNGAEELIPVAEVRVGDTVVTRPSEKVAVDGEIISGASSVNQAPITGESAPVRKDVGDNVFAGSINMEGYLEIKVTESNENTMVSRIIHLVEEAESQKAPSEKFVQTFAKFYTPSIVILAVGVAVIPPLLLGAAFNPWFIKALTLLVIACPCALVISTPVSVVSALTSASRNGVLIKGGVFLEELDKVKAIAFDKTGTLTSGKLAVTDVVSLNGASEDKVLQLAASLEARSEHPIAQAIRDKSGDGELADVSDFESVPGKGVHGKLNGEYVYVGRPELFADFQVTLPSHELHQLQQNGKTTMLVGTQSEFYGIIALSDQIRDDAPAMVRRLQQAGKEVIMITGDNEETAKAIAEKLGITHFHAGLLPEEKLDEISHLKERFGKVAMVGDGVNDAPALAAASVGIAMGTAGTDTALETADIALMSDDLSKLPYLFELSHKARNVIKQNIWASILIKFSLALGVFPGIVTLVVAVLIGDMGASLGVTANAMRLAQVNPKE